MPLTNNEIDLAEVLHMQQALHIHGQLILAIADVTFLWGLKLRVPFVVGPKNSSLDPFHCKQSLIELTDLQSQHSASEPCIITTGPWARSHNLSGPCQC